MEDLPGVMVVRSEDLGDSWSDVRSRPLVSSWPSTLPLREVLLPDEEEAVLLSRNSLGRGDRFLAAPVGLRREDATAAKARCVTSSVARDTRFLERGDEVDADKALPGDGGADKSLTRADP